LCSSRCLLSFRDPQAISDKLTVLSQELGIKREAATLALLKGALLFNYNNDTLRTKVQQLRQVVAGSPWSIDDIVAAAPDLLGELRSKGCCDVSHI
jgi:hypothetical protein